MGNAQNGNLSGQEKMDLLSKHKRLSDQYLGKTYSELTAADQFEIGISCDRLELDLLSVQPSAPLAEETQETGTDPDTAEQTGELNGEESGNGIDPEETGANAAQTGSPIEPNGGEETHEQNDGSNETGSESSDANPNDVDEE